MPFVARSMRSRGFSTGPKSSSYGSDSDSDDEESTMTDEERKLKEMKNFKSKVIKITLLPNNQIRVKSRRYTNENVNPSYYTPEKLIFPLSELPTFENVSILDFSNLNITEIPQEFLEPSITNYINTINLENSNLEELPSGILKFPKLSRLFLGNNQISTFPNEIQKLRYLIELSLINNKLESLPPEIGNLVKLETLNLENNKLESLPPEIGNLVELKTLNLQNNKFNDIPLRKVFIETNKRRYYNNRMKIDLSGNNIPPTKLSDFYFELENGRPKVTSLARDTASKVKNFFGFSGKSTVEPQPQVNQQEQPQVNQQETLPEQQIEKSPEQPVGGKRRNTKTMKKRRTRRMKKSVKKVGGKSRKAKRRTVKK